MHNRFTRWFRSKFGSPRPSLNDLQGNSTRELKNLIVASDVESSDGLLARCQNEWVQKKWKHLVRIDLADLEKHPHRTAIAMLVATAHQNLGDDRKAKRFLSVVQKWGVAEGGANEVVSQESLDLTDVREPNKRIACDETDLKVSTARENSDISPSIESRDIEKNVQTLLMRLGSLEDSVRRLQEEMKEVGDSVNSATKKELGNVARQLESGLSIQNYLVHGFRLPAMRGWPVSPDFSLELIELVDDGNYDLIIEFGSGTSTFLIAEVLKRKQAAGAQRPIQVAFEHLEKFRASTQRKLDKAGLTGSVDLVLSPLTDWRSREGETYPYYECRDKLSRLSKSIKINSPKILVLVDGPPGSTGKHARYPAVPCVLDHFCSSEMDVLLDDYYRRDERDVARKWIAEAAASGFACVTTEINTEKGACLLNIRPQSN